METADKARPDRALLVRLKELWFELRDDILQAQTQYAPDG
jgi:hypothetical protein